MDEVKDCSKSIQIAIFDKLIKTKDDTNIKKNFYSEAKFCENNIGNLIQYKSNISINNNENEDEINKSKEKMNT